VVPAKVLVKALAAMSELEIVLVSRSSDGRTALDVRAGTRTVTLQGWPTDDWPAVPRVAVIDPIASIDASATVDAFERVALCASDDESRPVLTCVALFIEEDPPALEVVATDSYRLGIARLPLEAGFRVSDGPLLGPARRSGSWPSSLDVRSGDSRKVRRERWLKYAWHRGVRPLKDEG
jgi:DNA polymerase III sliding clamp (beta) subunit (PCNA family)